jgi:hypothetical protein
MKPSFAHLDKYRQINGEYSSPKGAHYGSFIVKLPQKTLYIMAHDGAETGWEHVSVSAYIHPNQAPMVKAIPEWADMCLVKNLFWEPHEAVIQIHPSEAEYVNIAPNCLHLWRPTNGQMPTPPKFLV